MNGIRAFAFLVPILLVPVPDLAAAEPLVVAHRGASAEAPENTAAALRLALVQKADWIEFDVRATKDGVIVLQHDEHLGRFTGAETRIDSIDYEKVRGIDVGSWFDPKFAAERMIPLEQAVELCLPKARPLIERKKGTPEQVLTQIRKATDDPAAVAVIAFDWKFLAAFKKLSPKTPVGALGTEDLASQLPEILAFQPEWVGWKAADLDEKGVAAAKAAGLKVNVWTVDNAKEIEKFARWGVDAITTNKPAEARSVLKR